MRWGPVMTSELMWTSGHPAELGRRWYARRPFYVVGLVTTVAGALTWLLGWRYGHVVTTVGLLVMLLGAIDWIFLVTGARGVVFYRMSLDRSKSGDHAEAERFATKSVKAYRQFASIRPGERFRYAAALDHQRNMSVEAGHDADALAAAELAVAQWHVVVQLDRMGRFDELLAHITESIVHRRQLVAQMEELLASELANLSVFYQQQDDWPQALAPIEEAVAIRRRLASAPELDYPDRHIALAESLNTLAAVLIDAPWPADAAAPLLEAAEIGHDTPTEDDDARSRMARLYNAIGTKLTRIGLLTEALAAHERGLALRRLREPDQWLAGELAATCVVLRWLGRPGEALPLATQAAAIWRDLASDDAGNRARLAEALQDLSTVHQDLRELEAARVLNEQALEIITQLTDDDDGYVRHLITSLDDHAVLLARLGRTSQARETERRAALLRAARLREQLDTSYSSDNQPLRFIFGDGRWRPLP